MDLKAFIKGERPWVGDRGFAGIAQRGVAKPLIAAVEGFALAGGFEIALACDLIVAARGRALGIPEAKRSLVAAAGALIRLPKRMPYHVAMELALTGDPISAERGHELGIVNRAGRAGRRGRRGPRARRRNRPQRAARPHRVEDDPGRRARLGRGGGVGEAGRDHRRGVRSEDAQEGAIAFAEKRDPVWKGR